MTDQNESTDTPVPTLPTQAQLHDDLRRICQLEDQKQAIQNEIAERTERLRNALPSIDKESLLYQMLSASLRPVAKKRTTTATRATKKTTKKAPRKGKS